MCFEKMDLTWNMKCLLQGAFVVGVWWGASSTSKDQNSLFPKPEWKVPSVLFALGLFWVTYVFNGILDVNFSCEHGSFFDNFKAK